MQTPYTQEYTPAWGDGNKMQMAGELKQGILDTSI
jgi:hypothetical protein